MVYIGWQTKACEVVYECCTPLPREYLDVGEQTETLEVEYENQHEKSIDKIVWRLRPDFGDVPSRCMWI
uniref:MSP domain-containing protein n=1 Tax=Schistosoma mansoni TaxID=6183 RepID=A0A5K4F666_SCHMA